MSSPYRTPGESHVQHARKRWVVRGTMPTWARFVFNLTAGFVGAAFAHGHLRTAIAGTVFLIAAWCAAFVRREWV